MEYATTTCTTKQAYSTWSSMDGPIIAGLSNTGVKSYVADITGPSVGYPTAGYPYVGVQECVTVTSNGDLIFMLSCILFCTLFLPVGFIFNSFFGKTRNSQNV